MVAVLYALSIFSVLSLTVLGNAMLEKKLRTADDPDLHVVLYAGGAASQTVIGRLNIPTILRNQGSPTDRPKSVCRERRVWTWSRVGAGLGLCGSTVAACTRVLRWRR